MRDHVDATAKKRAAENAAAGIVRPVRPILLCYARTTQPPRLPPNRPPHSAQLIARGSGSSQPRYHPRLASTTATFRRVNLLSYRRGPFPSSGLLLSTQVVEPPAEDEEPEGALELWGNRLTANFHPVRATTFSRFQHAPQRRGSLSHRRVSATGGSPSLSLSLSELDCQRRGWGRCPVPGA